MISLEIMKLGKVKKSALDFITILNESWWEIFLNPEVKE